MKKFSYGKRTKYSKRRVYRKPDQKLSLVASTFATKARKNGQFFQRLGDQKALGSFFNGAQPFPAINFTVHRYSETFSLYADNVTGLVGSTQTMRLNHLFDPNSSGVGHQPMGFDQMAYIYGRYTVYAANVNIRVFAADGQTTFLALGIKPPVGSSSAWVMAGRRGENLIESQNCVVLDCPSTSPAQQWSSGWTSIAKWCGITASEVFNDVNFQGAPSSGPSQVVDLVLGVGTYNLEAGKYVRFNITIDYKVMWTQRNAYEQS